MQKIVVVTRSVDHLMKDGPDCAKCCSNIFVVGFGKADADEVCKSIRKRKDLAGSNEYAKLDCTVI
jgi:hypothetical protein